MRGRRLIGVSVSFDLLLQMVRSDYRIEHGIMDEHDLDVFEKYSVVGVLK